jgi:hypothetical protein
MITRYRFALGLACSLATLGVESARAQCGSSQVSGPGTVGGALATGFDVFAAGAAFYDNMSAVGHAIDAGTAAKWNEYLHQAREESLGNLAARRAGDKARNAATTAAILKRLRDNADARDLHSGVALNVLLEEISKPTVYRQYSKAAQMKIGGDMIRNIPFRYPAAAIEVGIHHLATGKMPAVLLSPEFEGERAALKALDQQLMQQVSQDQEPDPATVKKLLAEIDAFEEKAAKMLTGNALDRQQAQRYLQTLHGLVAMLNAPAFDPVVSGFEKRPETTLGELLRFMREQNLRFGAASTAAQRAVYRSLYSQLVQLRDEIAPAGLGHDNTAMVKSL